MKFLTTKQAAQKLVDCYYDSPPIFVTYTDLRSEGACIEAMRGFTRRFGNRAEVTVRNVERVTGPMDEYLNLVWAARAIRFVLRKSSRSLGNAFWFAFLKFRFMPVSDGSWASYRDRTGYALLEAVECLKQYHRDNVEDF